MPRHHPAPARELPDKPSLAQLRKQAKELLKSYRAGDPDSVAEVAKFERQLSPATFALADAQRILARAYGFASWSKLKQHIDGLTSERFCAAAEAGDLVTMRRIAKGRPELVNLERGGEFGERTALHYAVLNRDAEMTQALMELGADAQRGFWPYRDATSAYTIALERDYGEIVAIIDAEERHRRRQQSAPGATVNSATTDIHRSMVAGQGDHVRRLLNADPTLIGACDNHGVTPLHLAAWKHDAEMVDWLLQRGAAVDARAAVAVPVSHAPVADCPGNTPLDFAAISVGYSAGSVFAVSGERPH